MWINPFFLFVLLLSESRRNCGDASFKQHAEFMDSTLKKTPERTSYRTARWNIQCLQKNEGLFDGYLRIVYRPPHTHTHAHTLRVCVCRHLTGCSSSRPQRLHSKAWPELLSLMTAGCWRFFFFSRAKARSVVGFFVVLSLLIEWNLTRL